MEFNGLAYIQSHLRSVQEGSRELDVDFCLEKADLFERYLLAREKNKDISWAEVSNNPDKYPNFHEQREQMMKEFKNEHA